MALQDRKFVDAHPVVKAPRDFSDNVTFKELRSIFQNWIERLEWILGHKKEYCIE
jgi:hypothetical protein